MSLSKFEEDILNFLMEHADKSYSMDELASILSLMGIKKYKKLVKAMAFLERVGEVELVKGYKFRSVRQPAKTVVGTFRANSKGFGFITYDDGEADLFVPPGNSADAMHGDTVEAKVLRQVNPQTGKGSEAVVLRVVERSATQMVGEFFAYDQAMRQSTGYLGYIRPQGDYSDQVIIYVLPEGIHPVEHSICIVKIKDYPTVENPNKLIGYVAKEVGHKDAPGVDILAVLYQFNIPHEFPDSVIKEAEAVPMTIQADELAGRRDLRDWLIITIDGADAKDLDDAISLEKNADGTYQLGVHIADVSHYVTEGSALDREAFERGTSVYLTDRVVPMLPQRLSNGICSLHANEDRLTLTCEMTIDAYGAVINYAIYPSIINSSYRMTYDNVNKMLAGDDVLNREYNEIVDMIEEMAELHHILEAKRHRRGALDFDAPEAKIIVDESGHPLEIQLRERQVAERLIESFMLCANETVAQEFAKRQLPFLYRIHEQPKEEKMLRFAEFVTSFGMVLRGNVANIEPKQLQQALKAIKGQPYEPVVSTMMLRSMQQAKYSESPMGHYGLAAADYTHFTSPIRRYPDLIVHRLIRRYLTDELTDAQKEQLTERLVEIAEHSSKRERRAVEAERETDAIKKTEYMLDKVGQEFEGRITSITSFGMFVGLPNTIEGLIPIRALMDDYYEFNAQHLVLVGRNRGTIYRIGQQVTVEVEQVSVSDRTINFKLIDAVPMTDMRPIVLDSKKKNKKGHKQQKKATHFAKDKQKKAKGKAKASRTAFKKGKRK
ncbi:ribonuclease R [Tuanshanicoccus lijuaniae]|uniref:ribonuclease R n=1 Tax=Aerococcaceae bacterium zg-1292 TaxID=2774330 RepID=UPI001BD811E7|nr:ribonuclease R [Aerococcaceae bacterium zg-A91]MBS4458470.1 ribonuclease R [Aerococcaceae bacterium zg-BR33]